MRPAFVVRRLPIPLGASPLGPGQLALGAVRIVAVGVALADRPVLPTDYVFDRAFQGQGPSSGDRLVPAGKALLRAALAFDLVLP